MHHALTALAKTQVVGHGQEGSAPCLLFLEEQFEDPLTRAAFEVARGLIGDDQGRIR